MCFKIHLLKQTNCMFTNRLVEHLRRNLYCCRWLFWKDINIFNKILQSVYKLTTLYYKYSLILSVLRLVSLCNRDICAELFELIISLP